MATQNIILDLTFNFSLKIITLYQEMILKKEYVLSKQLLRCATSIGANAEEANAAMSKREFIAKMSIASKEARESKYWLRLLDSSRFLDLNYKNLLVDIQHIINILTKIVKTGQDNKCN